MTFEMLEVGGHSVAGCPVGADPPMTFEAAFQRLSFKSNLLANRYNDPPIIIPKFAVCR
jgi:hypothetical protein